MTRAREGCASLAADSSYVTPTERAQRDNTRFASPGTEFCSCNTSGTRRRTAAKPTGIDTYPPKPTTTSGRLAPIRRQARKVESAIRTDEVTSVRGRARSYPLASSASKGTPRSGTRRDSNPFGVPTKTTSSCSATSRSATVNAG